MFVRFPAFHSPIQIVKSDSINRKRYSVGSGGCDSMNLLKPSTGKYYVITTVNIDMNQTNGIYNQDYYLDHGTKNANETSYLKEGNIQKINNPTPDEVKRCLDGPYELPHPYNNNYICFTKDSAPGPFNGIITYARSEKDNELEMRASFQRFFLNNDTGLPTLQLEMTINISLSLETSEQYSLP